MTEKGSDPAPPPPWYALTPALYVVRMPCPHCRQMLSFGTRQAEDGDNGRAWVCSNPRCRAALGRVVVSQGGNTMVELGVRTREAIDAHPQMP